ncbi:gliding motility-associated peptidyl-prolyl isomerase GldI [Zobellia galactanivorans]|uniref:Peptidyl-prolyl cis-trans isomerase n=1 Tax=Zobellia galactanivorans (strain DSM 12802 / CCUG 47099 / CIP 106680 / NCIMB 13871 / Dsij) TaxID=63186 RepID=G0L805_ZOBGA|nr:gliding motility-associated peptidyl-prolyl isomerase GldI [Zobellia galactanivorans]MDO6807457.1 gliding motility-associated peptidyl-prolyl isomerase GldI [Zobellia galactanivorans]CAZ97839.1 Gliding motility FKBP-type peptidyl-prolyl cis-trans isomerase [Zobellia galactanivorans]
MRIVSILFLIVLVGCGGPEARRPVEVKSGSFFKQSVKRSKELLAKEEKMIQEIIERDTVHEYAHSASGSWFYYDVKNDTAEYTPQTDDLVVMGYNLVGFNNDTIYSMDDIGTLKYKVDKQELFPGLRNSVKMLKEGETATFLFPSSLAYGYHGDNDRIGINVPVRATVSVMKIEKKEDQEAAE